MDGPSRPTMRIGARAAWLAGLASMALLAFGPAGVHAQVPPAYELAITSVTVEGNVPTDGSAHPFTVAWQVECTGAAPRDPTQPGRLEFTMASDHFALATPDAPAELPDCATKRAAAGTAALAMTALPGATGEVDLPFSLRASIPILGAPHVEAQTDHHAKVAWSGGIDVSVAEPSKVAGPQQVLAYEVVVKNTGNARSFVVFELAGGPTMHWKPILPQGVLLGAPGADPPSEAIVVFQVATPYGNGPNEGAAEFKLDIWTQSVEDPTQTSAKESVTVIGQVSGWYVAGPGPALLVALLVLTMLVRFATRG